MKKYFLMLLTALSLNASGVGYYVSSLQGQSNGIGSRTKPWSLLDSINRNAFNPGDTVYFECGSTWVGSFEIISSGNEKKPIVFTSYGTGTKPSITNTSDSILDGNAIRVSANYIVIDGFYIHNCAGKNPRRLAAIGNIDRSNHHITVKNCETKGCKVGVRMYAHDVRILNNYFYDPGGTIDKHWGPMGIVGASYNVEIAYNRIENFISANGYGHDGGAIEVDDEGPKYNWRIHHNYSVGNEGFLEVIDYGECPNCTYADFFIYYNFSNDYQWWVDGPLGNNPVLENNTVISTRPKNSPYNLCISLHTDVPKASIKSNIFVLANGVVAFNKKAPSSNNIYYSLDNSVKNPKGFPLGKNEIIADPKFVNYLMANYHLTSASRAIKLGTNNSGYDFDLDGFKLTPRVSDAGCYKYNKLPSVYPIKHILK